jgi:hypothetical protein
VSAPLKFRVSTSQIPCVSTTQLPCQHETNSGCQRHSNSVSAPVQFRVSALVKFRVSTTQIPCVSTSQIPCPHHSNSVCQHHSNSVSAPLKSWRCGLQGPNITYVAMRAKIGIADRRKRLSTPLAGPAPIPWPQVGRLLPPPPGDCPLLGRSPERN